MVIFCQNGGGPVGLFEQMVFNIANENGHRNCQFSQQ